MAGLASPTPTANTQAITNYLLPSNPGTPPPIHNTPPDRPSSPPTHPSSPPSLDDLLDIPLLNPVNNTVPPKPKRFGCISYGTLNIRGGGSAATLEKWANIWHYMKTLCIGVY